MLNLHQRIRLLPGLLQLWPWMLLVHWRPLPGVKQQMLHMLEVAKQLYQVLKPNNMFSVRI